MDCGLFKVRFSVWKQKEVAAPVDFPSTFVATSFCLVFLTSGALSVRNYFTAPAPETRPTAAEC